MTKQILDDQRAEMLSDPKIATEWAWFCHANSVDDNDFANGEYSPLAEDEMWEEFLLSQI